MSRLLEARDLCVSFGTYEGRLRVLDHVVISVDEGERVALVGEAGCGKTTTMKCIVRVLPIPPGRIDSGAVMFSGRNLLDVNLRKVQGASREGISMIFQDPTAALNPVFTVGHQLLDTLAHCNANRHVTKRQLHSQAVEALRTAAMPDAERIMKNYPLQLSGGMRQRVCIALALATARSLLIADEPGTSLDVTIQDQILRLLNRLAEQRHLSVVLISHALGAVKNLADRVYVMYAGMIVESSRTGEFFSAPLHPYTKALLDAVPRLSGGGIAAGIPGRIPNYLAPPRGCRFHPRCTHAMEVCSTIRPTFYDVGHEHEVACFLYQGGK